jgi:hypothetical protein
MTKIELITRDDLNRIALLLNMAYSELTGDMPDLDTVMGCVAEAKALIEEA